MLSVHQQKAKLLSETRPHAPTSARFPKILKLTATEFSSIKFLEAIFHRCDDQSECLICEIPLLIAPC